MKKIPRFLVLPTLVALLALALACSNQADDGPSLSEGIESGAQAASGAAPTSIPVLPEVVTEFAAAQESINDDWDEFHVGFDRWRASLNACDRTAAATALRQFASDFAEITEQARDLPGTGIARELPDNVILAANGEEASLRMLRDKWQPGNPALLENAQTERGNAADLLRATAIEVDKLEELDKPEDQEIAEDFAEALTEVDEAWDAFINSYESLEDDHIDLTAAEIVTRLRELSNEHEVVLQGLVNLPSDKVTDPVQDPLVEAAEAEEEALGDLLDAMRRQARAEQEALEMEEGEMEGDSESENGENGPAMSAEEGAGPSGPTSEDGNGAPQGAARDNAPNSLELGETSGQNSPAAQGGVTTPVPPGLAFPGSGGSGGSGPPQQAETNGPENGSSSNGGADYSAHFDTFEETLDASRSIRKQAARDLEAIIEGVSEEDKEALAEFTGAFDDLVRNWDRFHARFDSWVRTEGDCDRSGVVSELNDFNQEFSALSNRVGDLSQVSYLRPSSDLLAEAAEREGAALRSLTGTWAPYENDVYRGFDDERANAANLRRLADRRTQELMERNGIQQ